MEHTPNDEKNQEDLRKIEQAENMMINTISETMDLYGVTPSVGRLYATLYFKHHPITLDEMKDELGMSKPSMSTSIRRLQEINIVQKVWQKGSRRDLFTAEKNFFNYFAQFFGNKWEREVRLFLVSIQHAKRQLKEVMEDNEADEDLREQARLDLEQLQEAVKYYHWMDRLTRLVQSGEIFNYLPLNEGEDEDLH